MFGHLDCIFNDALIDRFIQCSLCEALRYDYGMTARLLTNYDSSFFMALPLMLIMKNVQTENSHCPLFKKVCYARPNHPLLRFYAGITVLLIAEKIRDDQVDGEHRYPQAILKWIGRKRRIAEQNLGDLGFDPMFLSETFIRHRALEKNYCGDLNVITEPTATALSEIYANAGRLAGLSEYEKSFRIIGAAVGEIIYLMDSISDYDRDIQQGVFNPMSYCRLNSTCFTSGQPAETAGGAVPSEALVMIRSAMDHINEAIQELPADPYIQDLYSQRLAHRLSSFTEEINNRSVPVQQNKWGSLGLNTPLSVLLASSPAMASSSQRSGSGCTELIVSIALLLGVFHCVSKSCCGRYRPNTVTVDHGCGGTKTYRRDPCSGRYKDDSCC